MGPAGCPTAAEAGPLPASVGGRHLGTPEPDSREGDERNNPAVQRTRFACRWARALAAHIESDYASYDSNLP